MRRPLFLDRDGVLNVDVSPYVQSASQFHLFPWTIEALCRLYNAGFELFVISNQQGVSLGLTPESELVRMGELLQGALRANGAEIKKFYYATALSSERHPWRKPAPGMILAARDEFGLDLRGTFMVGDKYTDIECGSRAGCRTVLVESGVTPPGVGADWDFPPEATFANLANAAEYLIRETFG